MELNLIAIKREDGLYHFNHSHQDTVEELLCNGTEKVLDTHYYFLTGRTPIADDELKIFITTEEPENENDYDTVLTFKESDDEGTVYIDEVMCDDVWLCPWLQGYFKITPEKLYIKLNATNKGLVAFVQRTGMYQFGN